ncbi:ABC transporter ATP-binding protein [Nitrincola sp. MINF-07-Sa-05]|uniref:ABC transporter ATP-binding protein n=1 Tax=Nitrincola salilacus TaxID=3400273 RepID=UPI003917D55C
MTDTELRPAILIKQLTFAWKQQAPLLNIDHFILGKGEQLFLQGPSGSGKSTLLNLIGGVLSVNSGELTLHGSNFGKLSQRRRDQFRADHIGVLFQQFNLLPYLNLIDNVILPCRFSSKRAAAATQRSGSPEKEAHRLLQRLQLQEMLKDSPPVAELSIGQQQRVAAARALIGAPELIIADEPTSALDADTRDNFLDLLLSENRENHSSLLFVSHDQSLSHHFDRVVSLSEINQRGAA